MVAGLPEHKIRVISPDIGGGFGNKVPIYPGYLCAIVASRCSPAGRSSGPRTARRTSPAPRSPATTSCAARSRRPGTAGSSAIRAHVLADHGAFNGVAAPTKYPAGFFGVFTGSYDIEAAHCTHDRRLHQQGARAASRTPARSGSPRPCTWSSGSSTAWPTSWTMDPVELRRRNLLRPEQFPYTSQDRVDLRLGRLRAAPCARRCGSPTTTGCAASRRSAGRGAS